jgi:hypothetical protein
VTSVRRRHRDGAGPSALGHHSVLGDAGATQIGIRAEIPSIWKVHARVRETFVWSVVTLPPQCVRQLETPANFQSRPTCDGSRLLERVQTNSAPCPGSSRRARAGYCSTDNISKAGTAPAIDWLRGRLCPVGVLSREQAASSFSTTVRPSVRHPRIRLTSHTEVVPRYRTPHCRCRRNPAGSRSSRGLPVG